jgi:hypothetical protein
LIIRHATFLAVYGGFVKPKSICFPLIIILAAAAFGSGQTPPPGKSEAQQRIEAERELRMRNMREFDTKMQALNRQHPTASAGPTIDKETSERIRVARRVEPADLARYAAFLNADKTGIFKLFPDHDCVTKNVVRTDGDCRDFIMASSSFSFRTRAYAHPYYHDLGFNNDEFLSNAFFSQGLFVSLGDTPIEGVTNENAGLKFVTDFRPAFAPAEARNAASLLKAGIESGGFRYSSSIRPVEHTTYVLRSIAYDVANSLPPISERTSASELRFHTLALDKRADVIVVFRVVRTSSDGSLTIVWKELERKEAPKIKFAKRESFADFRP